MGTVSQLQVVCCVTASTLVVANCGDSRAVLCRAGRAIGLSQDFSGTLQQICATTLLVIYLSSMKHE